MSDRIVTVNKKAFVKKIKKTASSVTKKAKTTSGRVVAGVASKATGVRNKVQNRIVDTSLAVNNYQRNLIEKCRREG